VAPRLEPEIHLVIELTFLARDLIVDTEPGRARSYIPVGVDVGGVGRVVESVASIVVVAVAYLVTVEVGVVEE